MDVEYELDNIANWICKGHNTRPQLLYDLVEYCELYALTRTIGYALLRDCLNDCLILKQQSLTKLFATTDDVIKSYRAIKSVLADLPVKLHKFFVFAEEALKEKERPLLALFSQRLNEAWTIPELLRLLDESSRTLSPESDFPVHVTKKIEQRRECLRFEIYTHFDRPLSCGSIPELELKALNLADELELNDEILHPLIIEICFLFLAYLRDFNSELDVGDELKSFKWCRLLGVRHVLPEISRHVSRSAMLAFKDKLKQALEPKSDDPFLTSVFERELQYINSGISDGKCIWELIPANLELPLLLEEIYRAPGPSGRTVQTDG
jgi:hypothetical protein